MLSYLVLNAADVAIGLKNLARHSRSLSVSGIAVETVVMGAEAHLVFEFGARRPDRYRQYFEHIAAVLCSMMRPIVGPDWNPVEIHLEHSAATAEPGLFDQLDAPVSFERSQYAIVFESACLVPRVDCREDGARNAL
jgi:hypothetical protein